MKFWWQSSYDRGLDILLLLWPRILKEIPNATLDICYGWDLFLRAYSGNPERMMWKNQMDEKMKQKGITHHGRIGQSKMRDLRKTMDIWAYPTYFTEINCIGALECQHDGVVPCVINLAALKETVGSGVKVDGDIYSPEVREKYLKELLALCKDKKRIEEEREKGKKFVKDYTWAKRAKEWTKYMEL